MQDWKIAGYKHQGKELAAFFAGKHGTVPCAGVPQERRTGTFPAGAGTAVVFKGTSAQCASCHKDAHNGTLGTRCESCHNLEIWKNASRAFHKDTIFPLEGRHLSTPCGACHLNGVIKGTPNRCFDCHWIRTARRQVRDPARQRVRRGSPSDAWTAVTWNHGQATGFSLGGSTGCSARNATDEHVYRALAPSASPATRRDNVFTGLRPSATRATTGTTREPRNQVEPRNLPTT